MERPCASLGRAAERRSDGRGRTQEANLGGRIGNPGCEGGVCGFERYSRCELPGGSEAGNALEGNTVGRPVRPPRPNQQGAVDRLNSAQKEVVCQPKVSVGNLAPSAAELFSRALVGVSLGFLGLGGIFTAQIVVFFRHRFDHQVAMRRLPTTRALPRVGSPLGETTY